MRSAAVGLRSLPMASGAWRTVQAAAARGVPRQQRRQPGLVADQQEAGRGMAFGGDVEALHHDRGRMVAAHGIDRQGERDRGGGSVMAGPLPRSTPRHAAGTPRTAMA